MNCANSVYLTYIAQFVLFTVSFVLSVDGRRCIRSFLLLLYSVLVIRVQPDVFQRLENIRWRFEILWPPKFRKENFVSVTWRDSADRVGE